MNNIFEIVWISIQITVGFYLVYPMILFLIFNLKSKKEISEVINSYNPNLDYAIIVTAYEQTHLLPETVNSILKLNYSRYHVYVVADNCDISKLEFSDPRVSVLRPEHILASNTKSHFHAIKHFVRQHDVLTIIDSDNLVHSEYINELDLFFRKGYQAVQGVRAPKNLNTTLACLDAARDIYYNYYDGQLLFQIGSSATLAGSGMAFNVRLYKECLEKIEIQGAGFDKVLQAEIVKRGHVIAHASRAIVYDEKTSHSQQLVNQRSRWINTWFKYVRYGGELLLKSITHLNKNQFFFGITLLRPPLFMFILTALGCMSANLMMKSWDIVYWLIAFLLFCFSFFIALKEGGASNKIYKSLLSVHKFVYLQVVSLIYSRKANKRSIATKHT